MRSIFFTFLVLVVSIFPSMVSSANLSFDYRVISYPDELGNCQATAKGIGQRLEKIAGVHIESIHAARVASGACNITVTYEAAARLAIETTYTFPDGALSAPTQGTYRSWQDCQADLLRQENLFERATLLRPFVGYCFRDPSVFTVIDSNRPYAMKIDGIGKAAKHYFFRAIDIERPFSNQARLADEIFAALDSRGVLVSYAVVTTQLLGSAPTLNFAYYAPEALSIYTWPDWLPMEVDCESVRSRAVQLLEKIGEPPLTSYCLPGSDFQYPGLMVIALSSPNYRIEDSPDRYSTYEECEAAGASLSHAYENPESWKTEGAFCAVGWNGFEMSVFEKRIGYRMRRPAE